MINMYEHIKLLMPSPRPIVSRDLDPALMQRSSHMYVAELSRERLIGKVREVQSDLWQNSDRCEYPTRIYFGLYEFENLCICPPPRLKDELPFPDKVCGTKIIFTPHFEGVLPTWE